PALGFEFRRESVRDERVLVRAGDEENRSALAAVAAVRPAARDELLAAETHAPVAAVAGAYFNVDFVNEHKKSAALKGPPYDCSTGLMLMTRPFSPWFVNFTTPVTFAN